MQYQFPFARLVASVVLLSCNLYGEPEISEFLASNSTGLTDEDDQASDWIEIYNPDAEPVALSGYYLTDDSNDLTKWAFPETSLGAKGYRIVWASGKDRAGESLHTNFSLSSGGEYLALVAPDGTTILSEFTPYPEQVIDTSYGFGFASKDEVLIAEGAGARWHVPSAPLSNWADEDFDDATWIDGKSGFGYGFGDLVGEGSDVKTAMQAINGSVYVRFPFEITDPDSVVGMTVRLKFEDGFAAFLNGDEVASENAPATLDWNSTSTESRADALAEGFEEYDIPFGGKLKQGRNLLGFQAMNATVGGSDLLLLPELVVKLRQGEESIGYMRVPTPGTANESTAESLPSPPEFSAVRGFYEAPFQLVLSTDDPATSIRYTLDGKLPTLAASKLYTQPIEIAATTPVRAIAVRDGEAASPPITHTYIFVDDVIEQSPFKGTQTRKIVADETYGPLLKDSLRSLPVVCLASNQRVPGASEQVTSIELFDPKGEEEGFQVDCGIKLVGGASTGSQKNNLRLYFRSRYGYSKLRYPLFEGHPYSENPADEFDILQLRGGSHDNFFWLALPSNPTVSNRHGDAQYVRNRWIHDMQFLMGHESIHGRFVQLFINGLYHGLYHLHERPMAGYHASYLGGQPEEYHYTNSARTGSDHGGGNRWTTTWAAVKSSARTDYEAAKKMIDVENLADYMLLNFYAGNTWDWSDQHNWMAGGPRDPDRGGWKFYCWDSDIILQDVRNNPITMNVPDGLFQQLLAFDDFRVMFRDRVYKFCFNNGALTPEKVAASYNYRMEEIFLPIVAETARWQPTAATKLPWDRDGEWTTEWNHFREIWFPQRTGLLLDQLRTTRLRGAPLYPIETPEFRQRGGNVDPGYVPGLTTEKGTIYFTVDGSDPRLLGGKISPTAKAFAGGKVPVTFVERGAEWKFHDDGENLGAAWQTPGYDDSQWSSGHAQLGYGERDEMTVVSTGPDPFLKNPTTYFRLGFDIADAAAVTDLTLELLRDDGAVVYLNGTEILRDNMPEGAITFDSLAVDGASGSSESTFFSFEIPPGAMVSGRNVLAVEIHQESAGSSDLSFDLGLTGRRLSGAPDLTITAPTFVRMRALDDDEWSGINEALFTLTGTATASADNVIVSEIHYNPSGDDDSAAEFIEIHNTTGSPMDLSNVEISGAVKFVFPSGTVLPAQGVIVVTSDMARFATIYPDAFGLIAGQWDGSLSNGGERIKISASDGSAILNFKYGDGNRWPGGADGGGSSLELSDIAAAPTGFDERSAWLENPDHWQASSILNGSPGAIPGAESTAYDDWVTDTFPQDASPQEVSPDADYDGDGNSNFIEFAFVRNATVPDSSAILTITNTQNGAVKITFPVRPGDSGVRYFPQWSPDLQLWQDGTIAVDSVVDKPGDDGTTTRTLTILPGEPVSAFFRVEVR